MFFSCWRVAPTSFCRDEWHSFSIAPVAGVSQAVGLNVAAVKSHGWGGGGIA